MNTFRRLVTYLTGKGDGAARYRLCPDPTNPLPRLMVTSKNRMSEATLHRIRETLTTALRENKIPVLEGVLTLHQYIPGRWEPLDSPPPRAAFRIEDEGPHWKIDCRTDLDHATLFDLVDTDTGLILSGLNAVAANDDLGLILVYRLDDRGMVDLDKGGLAYKIMKANFLIIRKGIENPPR